MGIIGDKVVLITKSETGTDPLGEPITENVETVVYNVLIGEPSSEERINELNLTGKKLAYTLAIPKGDTHNWEDADVRLPYPFNCTVHTYGSVTYGIEKNIPLSWNGKVKTELLK